jgi:hypothetical protein
MAKAKQKIMALISIITFVFVLASSVGATEITGILNTGGLNQATVNNCNPLAVAHGSVSAFPVCAITCESGYTKSNNQCIAPVSSGGGGGGGGSVQNNNFGGADFNNDGKIDIVDLNILMLNWGAKGNNASDLNHDGAVNILDFNLLMLNWSISAS